MKSENKWNATTTGKPDVTKVTYTSEEIITKPLETFKPVGLDVIKVNSFVDCFIAAQKEMKSALKDSENPFFKSKYADLTAIDAACKHALNSHGIAITQQIDFEGTTDFIRTELWHVSGEKLVSRCRLINPKGDSQGFGSSVSYMRRYSLAAICGIVTEDDDGHASSHHGDFKSPGDNKISQPQAARLFAISNEKGWSQKDLKDLIETYGYESTKDITKADYDKICADIN